MRQPRAKAVAHFGWCFSSGSLSPTLAERRGACCLRLRLDASLATPFCCLCACVCRKTTRFCILLFLRVVCVVLCLGLSPTPHTATHFFYGISQWAKARIPPGLPTPSHSPPTTPRLRRPYCFANYFHPTDNVGTEAPRAKDTHDQGWARTTPPLFAHDTLAWHYFSTTTRSSLPLPSRQGRRPLLCFLHIWGMPSLFDLTRLASRHPPYTQSSAPAKQSTRRG